jgi:hypothetical protein
MRSLIIAVATLCLARLAGAGDERLRKSDGMRNLQRIEMKCSSETATSSSTRSSGRS